MYRLHKTYLRVLLALFLLAPIAHAAEKEAPANDLCEDAPLIGFGTIVGSSQGAGNDGSSNCGLGVRHGADVWYRFLAPESQPVTIRKADFGATRVSVHTRCPATSFNQLACGEEALSFQAEAGKEVLVRVNLHGLIDEFTVEVLPGATISGQVIGFSGETIEGIGVAVRADGSTDLVARTLTDAEGRYTLPVYTPGIYFVLISNASHERPYQAEVYDDLHCTDSECTSLQGEALFVPESGQLTDIDFRLDRFGSISGTVTNAITSEPLGDTAVSARLFRLGDAGSDTQAFTDGSGQYRIDELPPEPHRVRAQNSLYRDEIYDDVPCPLFSTCFLSGGTPLTPPLNGEITGVDFALGAFGSLSGQVRDRETGEPLPEVSVVLTSENNERAFRLTDKEGRFTFGGLVEATYFVATNLSHPSHFDAVYQGIPCPEDGCDHLSGTPIPLLANQHIDDIDFTLEPADVLSGQVRWAGDGAPIENLHLYLNRERDNGRHATVRTDAAGRYSLPLPRDGSVFVYTQSFDFINEIWDEVPCDFLSCDVAFGTPLQAGSGHIQGIDFELDRGGILEGRVTDENTGQALSQSVVQLYDDAGELIVGGPFNEDGFYFGPFEKAQPLLGTYYLFATSPDFQDEVYDDIPCPEGLPACGLGTPIPIGLNQVFSELDFALEPVIPSIEGTVRDRDGMPLDSIAVDLYNAEGERVGTETTDAEGIFTFPALDPGNYFAVVENPRAGRFLGQVFRNLPCSPEGCDPLTGTPIQVQANRTSAGIHFALEFQGRIVGSVLDTALGAPVPEADILLFDSAGRFLYSQDVFGGRYRIELDAPGEYFVATANQRGYFDQVYPGIPCAGRCNDPALGTPVRVDQNTVATADFRLEPQQGLLGRVTQKGTGAPIPRTRIIALDAVELREVASALTQADGRFLLPLPLGEYYLMAERRVPEGDFQSMIFPDIPCLTQECSLHVDDPTQGDRVRMEADTLSSGFDFELEGNFCLESPTSQCLQGDRFRASLSFTTPGGDSAPGQIVPLTQDTGAFYFFEPDNLEVVVKVIDACAPPYNHFWVFAAGLTNLETRLVIRDTATLEERVYETTGGEPFQLIRDTRAFDTCNAGEGTAAPADAEDRLRTLVQQVQEFEAPVNLSEEDETTKIPGFCLSNETRLCLVGDRFEVEVFWSHDGDGGVARAVQLTDETGYFWFFREDNVEVVTKIIDACTLDDFNNFWVFAAGLTDVETIVWVRDTVTSESRQYVNPSGTPFAPIQDTRAFDTCP